MSITRVTNPRLRGSPRQKAHSPFGGVSGPSSSEMTAGEARGGAIVADLLEEHSVLEDAALVETILLEKLGAAAEEARIKLGFAWADAMLRYDYATMADYGRVYPGPIEPDEAAQKRIDQITAALEQLQLQMEDEGLEDDAYNALYERVDALEDEARDLEEAYSTEDLARSGVIASWQGGHRWQYLPDCHRDPLQARAAKAPLLPHRGNWWARTPVEGLACGLGAAQLCKGRGQSCAGGVHGGAGWLSFPLRQQQRTTRAYAADLKSYLK